MSTPGTAVTAAKTKPPLPERIEAHIQEARIKNAMVAQIRGTIWGKDLNPQAISAVAQYCRETGLDPVRHVEILGGRLYLTAEFYIEKGAPLVTRGLVTIHDPDFIHADPRLEELASKGGEMGTWAATERDRRLKLRIEHAAPEGAKAISVQRLTLTTTGRTVVGVNWVGGSNKKDPVGESEPTKTATTRALRRAWKQLAEIVPEYAATVQPAEARAQVVNEMPALEVEPVQSYQRPALAGATADDLYASPAGGPSDTDVAEALRRLEPEVRNAMRNTSNESAEDAA